MGNCLVVLVDKEKNDHSAADHKLQAAKRGEHASLLARLLETSIAAPAQGQHCGCSMALPERTTSDLAWVIGEESVSQSQSESVSQSVSQSRG
jgi:hypothetical protein